MLNAILFTYSLVHYTQFMTQSDVVLNQICENMCAMFAGTIDGYGDVVRRLNDDRLLNTVLNS